MQVMLSLLLKTPSRCFIIPTLKCSFVFSHKCCLNYIISRSGKNLQCSAHVDFEESAKSLFDRIKSTLENLFKEASQVKIKYLFIRDII
jgi:hypothetical protein